MGHIIWLGGGYSVKYIGWLKSFVIAMILEELSFLGDVTYLEGGVPVAWFGLEVDLIAKDIVDDRKGLGSNLEGRGIMIIVSLGWDIY